MIVWILGNVTDPSEPLFLTSDLHYHFKLYTDKITIHWRRILFLSISKSQKSKMLEKGRAE